MGKNTTSPYDFKKRPFSKVSIKGHFLNLLNGKIETQGHFFNLIKGIYKTLLPTSYTRVKKMSAHSTYSTISWEDSQARKRNKQLTDQKR